MKISELIKKLDGFKTQYGDIEVMSSNDLGNTDYIECLNRIKSMKVCNIEGCIYRGLEMTFPSNKNDNEINLNPKLMGNFEHHH